MSIRPHAYLVLITFPTPVLALDTQGGIPVGYFLQAFLALTIVLFLLLGTAWLTKKISQGKPFGFNTVKVVGGLALGPKERIILIEVGDEWLVIGIVPGQIRTLHRLPRQEMLNSTPIHQMGKPFSEWLRNISRRDQDV